MAGRRPPADLGRARLILRSGGALNHAFLMNAGPGSGQLQTRWITTGVLRSPALS